MDNFTHDPALICALILAGGAGRRVGGRDKGLLSWQGRPVIEHVLTALKPQVSDMLISCNRNREHYARIAPLAPADLRDDYQGPLAGIEAAKSAVTRKFVLLAPCDTPRLPGNLAEKLALALHRVPKSQAAYVRADGRDHYLCALLRRESLAGLTPYLDSGQRAVRNWYARINAVAVDFPDNQQAFINLNENGDFD